MSEQTKQEDPATREAVEKLEETIAAWKAKPWRQRMTPPITWFFLTAATLWAFGVEPVTAVRFAFVPFVLVSASVSLLIMAASICFWSLSLLINALDSMGRAS